MKDVPPFLAPEITDTHIRWACRLLQLPMDAFHGENGEDPRLKVLKSMGQMDVAACPGSGKTTLLVAKLAILAQTWQDPTRGICVLSHTNAARYEIETKLGNTNAGRRLLSYPHYIGTIHRFVNEFLALPWLRSQGYAVKMIDTVTCERRRWRKLDPKVRSFLQRNHVEDSNIRILNTNFNLAKKNGMFPCGEDTLTYKKVKRACEQTASEGYHCFDDMFIWADEMMGLFPWFVDVIRDRFPLLFIDEAQDNSEAQSAILYRIFKEGNTAVVRQRFGDANQAVFNFAGEEGAKTDVFPNQDKEALPNSHRFGQTIANLADPLGLEPYGLKGHGPASELLSPGLSEGRHTIFVFDDASLTKVLDAYGELLLDTFSEQGIQEGIFTAVGQVHRDTGDDYKPRHLGHYWPNYDPELTSTDPKPETFVQYVFAGRGKAEATKESHPAVEKIAEGLLRLAGMAEGGVAFHERRHRHRQILELLAGNADVQMRYRDLIMRFAVDRDAPTKETWGSAWRCVVREIAETLAGVLLSEEALAFLEWKEMPSCNASPVGVQMSRDNLYRFRKGRREAIIHVGSIHSVKGKTHTATLVLETFWQGRQGKHNLELMLPWLRGLEKGGLSEGVQQQARLKLHYVAMTRPTHLLCLAMQRSVFTKNRGDIDPTLVQELEQCGWHIKPV